MSDKTHQGSCFCGAVRLEVTGEPAAMGYCHCGDCRSWLAAPVNAFSLWKPDQVRVTRGAELVATYQKTERSLRKFCKTCGGHLMTDHPHWNLVDVYAAVLADFVHQAGVHVHYRETVLRMHDGVTKMSDLPTTMGGSGQTIPE